MKNQKKLRAGLPALVFASQSYRSAKRVGQKRWRAGQTILEVLLALGASVIILGAVTIAVVSSLNNAQFSKNQNLANHYAWEGMEVIRKIRDSSWANFSSYTDKNYCLPQQSTELQPKDLNSPPGLNCVQNVGIFVREVVLERNAADCEGWTKASMKVSWSDSKCGIGTSFCHNVLLVSCFSNLDAKQIP